MEERRQKQARHKKTERQMAKLFTSDEEKDEHRKKDEKEKAERRLKDTLRKKKERQMKTEEETGIFKPPLHRYPIIKSHVFM